MPLSGLCPLCFSKGYGLFQSPPFFRCNTCQLIFKDPALHLAPNEEKVRYDMHENNINDAAYVKFLSPVVEEVTQRLSSPSKGLDYGSGPEPVLVELLKRKSFATLAYDPFFSPINLNEIKDLDFIVSTEAAEHFYHPGKEFEQIFRLLRPNGLFILKTEFYKENIMLKDWHYPRDPTHVCFYSESCLQWIAGKYAKKLSFPKPSLAVFEG